jgi:Na+/H+ antiporter NhaD/arsenite permease-like protein
MLLIRLLLRTNSERRHTRHIPFFFILLVSNAGGLLTPLGDPPLFLGFLRGVPFTWTLRLFPIWLLAVGYLLVLFYWIDRRAYARETAPIWLKMPSNLSRCRFTVV